MPDDPEFPRMPHRLRTLTVSLAVPAAALAVAAPAIGAHRPIEAVGGSLASLTGSARA